MSYFPPSRPDPWADRIAGIAALRGMLGESTIKESSTIGLVTRVTMPLLQVMCIGFGFVWFAAGGWIMIDGVVRSFGIAVDGGMYLTVLLTLLVLILATWKLAQVLIPEAKGASRWALAIVGLLFLLVAVLNLAIELQSRWDLWRFLEMTGGAGMVLSGALLVWHQILNVTDPYWRTSPAERELLAMWRNQPDPDTTRTAKRIPYRHSGRRNRLLAEQDTDDLAPDPIEYELLDFLEQARTIGLGRNAWLGSIDRWLASTGAKVTRPKYDELMAILIDNGHVVAGGGGTGHSWRPGVSADEVYEKECQEFEDAWGNVLGLADATKQT